MSSLTDLAHRAVEMALASGDVAVDATCGNGRDTRFLAGRVGPTGHVFALDIQPHAIQQTASALGNAANVVLLIRDHSELLEAIPLECHGRIGAVMFNLGYLPGGDPSIVTQTASTVLGLSAALKLLRPGGVLTVLAYPGHAGGTEETDAVAGFVRALPDHFEARVEHVEYNRPDTPRLYLVHKRAATSASTPG